MVESSLRSRLLALAGISWLVLGLLTIVISFTACLLGLPRRWAVVGLAIHLFGLLLPLQPPPPAWAKAFLAFVTTSARDYFPMTVEFEDKDAFKEDKAYLIGYEPHSVLPVGTCMFTRYAQAPVPPSLANSHIAVTGTVFLAPYMRNFLWWLGCRSASREVLQSSLDSGTTVVLCPGGVQECFYMDPQPDKEVAFLKQRTGFIRLAMRSGAPVTPVFAFGQTNHYRYWRPFIDTLRIFPMGSMASLVRRIGYVPMLVWGYLGSAVPYRVPMHLVVGKPIQVPHRADPSPEEVRQYLDQYIAALQGIFERHKAAAGHASATLTII